MEEIQMNYNGGQGEGTDYGDDVPSVTKYEVETTIKSYEEILSGFEDKNSEKAKMFRDKIEELKEFLKTLEQ